MKHTLIITQNNQQQTIVLNPKKPLKLKAKANTTYKIVDETGQIIDEPVVKTVGDDVYVYLSGDDVPAFVLENYERYLPITDAYALEQMGANLATSSVAGATGISTSALWTTLGAMGVGAVALSGHGKSDNANHNLTATTPIQTTPVVPPTPPAPIPAKVATVEVAQSINEGQDVVATVTLDNSNGAENIPFTISGLQADDYGALVFSDGVTQNTNGTLNIPKGITEFTVSLPIIADNQTEGNETLTLKIGEQSKEVTVNDTSTAPTPAKVATVEVAPIINENETLTATIKLDNANGAENVAFTLSGLQADDYGTLTFSDGITQNTDGTLNIPKGITEFTVSLPIIADNQTEGNETLTLKIGEQSKEVTVNDTSTAPTPAKVATVEVAPTINENETLTATIKLDNANGAENVPFAITGLTTDDYGTLVFSNGVTQNTDGTLNIPKGVTSFTISLPIIADNQTEGNETLTVKVGEQTKEVTVNDTSTAPIPAKVATVEVAPTINENETLTATVKLDNANGAKNVTFTISGLQADDYGNVSFSNGVTQNTDGTLNIPKGITEFTVSLPIIADNQTEGNEVLAIKVGEQEKEVIINDTSTTPIPAKVATVEVTPTINENETLTATIKLDNANGAENVVFNLSGLQADDYGNVSFSNGVTQNTDGTLTIPKGVEGFTISLPIIADNQTEGNEVLAIKVGEQIKEVIINDTSTTPIVVPPTPPAPIPAKVASIEVAQSVNESETLTATIKLDNANGAENVTFVITGLTTDDYGTLVFSNGVTQNSDGTLNIPKGVTEFTISLPIIADQTTENVENLTLKVGEQTKEVVVNDTSTTPVVIPPAPAKVASVETVSSINESETLTAKVILDNSNGAENVAFTLSGLQADDYSALTFSNGVTQNTDGTLNIPKGITEFTVSLPIIADQTTENVETLKLTVGEQTKEVTVNDTSTTPVVVPPSDTTAPTLTVTIEGISEGKLDLAESRQQHTLKGQLSTNEVLSEKSVTVKIGNQTYQATISTDGTSWTLPIAGDILAQANEAVVTFSGKDMAGNEASVSSETAYTVDLSVVPLSVSIHAIDDGMINIADKSQDFTLTGKLTFDKTTTERNVVVKINGTDYPALIEGDVWSLPISGEKLAFAQGEQSVTVILTAKDIDGQPISTQNTGIYQVDTKIDTPVITFADIADDNVINLAESGQNVTISGTVEHAKEGDIVKVMIGGVSKDVPLQGGKFSLTVAGETLKTHNQISATIITTDTAGNSATGETVKAYEVDTIAPTPKITLNPITGNNIIDLTEKTSAKTKITGQLTQIDPNDTNDLVLVCLCTTCTNNNKATFEARLNADGSFSTDIDTAELMKYDSISATIKSTDKAGNTGVDTDTQTYKVEKDPVNTPAITLNPIAGDNIVNSAEFNFNSTHPNIAITGKIERAEVANSSVKLEFYKAGILIKTVDAELGADGVYTYRISGAELHRSYDTVKAILTTGGQSYDHSQSYKAAAYSPRWGDIVPTFVSDDNTIDQNNTWHDTTTITGTFNSIRSPNTAQGIENAMDITVTVNGKAYMTTVVGQTGTFSVNVKTADLLADNDKVADVSAYLYDNAGNNAGTKTTTLKYNVNDTHINKPVLTITPIEDINIAYQNTNPSTTLTGTFELDGDVALTNAPLTIEIGGQTFIAQKTVTSSGNGQKTIGTWTLDVPTQTLINANGNLTAKLFATDHTGNQAQTDTPATYKADVVAPMVEVKLNAITGDNAITPDEIADTFTITGTVAGEFNASDTVFLTIGDRIFEVPVSQGKFSQVIDKSVIFDNTQITARLTTADGVGNVGGDEDSITYAVNTQEVKIEFDNLTTDNLINVSEQFGKLTLSGRVSGSGAKAGQIIELSVDGEVFRAFVLHDYSFEVQIDGRLLANNNGYTVSAKLLDSGNFVASATHRYEVAKDVSAGIKIHNIGTNTHDNGTADGFGSVRVSGKLAFNDSLFAQGYNEDTLQAIVINIGNKSFHAGFNRDDYSFHIDLTAQEAKELNGLPISHQIITAGKLQHLAGTDANKTVRKENVTSTFAKGELDKITIDWHESATTLKNGEYLINATPKTTDIEGVVSGSAQMGDSVTIKVGETQYQTKVAEGNTFKVAVDSEALKTANGKIEAVLTTKDLANNTISVTDTAQFGKFTKSTGEFVSKHTPVNDRVLTHSDEGHNFAYMIDSVATKSTAGFLNYRHTPFGGFTDNNAPATIKYYFATQAETTSPDWQYQGRGYVAEGSTRDFSDNLKNIVKSMLTKYENIANVRFEEVSSRQEVGGSGINFIYGDTIGAFAGSGAFAYEGGNVVFDTANFTDNPPGNYHVYLALHELFHTFAGRHTDGYYEKLGYARAEDYTSEFSVMSYSPDYHWSKGYKDLSLYDVMYMHYRFGVAKTVNAGDDVYGFGHYASFVQDGTVYVADASGVDTFDASHENTGVTVNLTPGSWIYHTDKFSNSFIANNKTTISDNATYFADQNLSGVSVLGNIDKHTHLDYVKGQGFIGYGTQIENLKGSNFADVLTGNNANNVIFGNDGNDVISGGLGDDYLDGGKGADTLMGGLGDDSYVIDDKDDVITENAGEGNDSVYSHISYTLGNELENLILLGADHINATGNDLGNTLIGNGGDNTLTGGAGVDVLDGGRGSDTLMGGAGADYFRFSTLLDGSVDTIVDYHRGDIIELDDDIFTALRGLNPSEVGAYVKYDVETGQLSYDADGDGGVGNAIHFATLKAGLDTQDINYQII